MDKPLPHRQRLRQLDLKVTHVTAAQRFGEARDRGLADVGLLGQLGNRQSGHRVRLVQNELRDTFFGAAQLNKKLCNARDNVDIHTHRLTP
ncbi:hypothetical protein D3C86_1935760 [compost metagenome]